MEGGIPEIVIDGGPCSGKTTGISYFVGKLRDIGYRVFVVPEVATMLINPGLLDISSIAAEEPELYYAVEREMFRIQRALRKRFISLAREFPKEKTVILYDRGTMSVGAYLTEEKFARLINEEKTPVAHLRDIYDGVILLVTAADGAERFYTTANNIARRESAEEARSADQRTQKVWSGRDHVYVIDNSTDF